MGQITEPLPDASSGTKASLLDAESTGGPKAIRGFDFQRRYALILLLELLADPDWTAILVEGAEDVEVRFDRKERVERKAIQLKNYRVTTAKAREIINHFHKLDGESPGTWSEFIIACTELDETLKTIHNGLERFRPSGAFYTSNDALLVNTRDDLINRVNAAKLPAEFVLEQVSFKTDIQSFKEETWVKARALDLLHIAYPGISYLTTEAIYLRLASLVSESTGKPVERQEVERIINQVRAQTTAPADYVPIKLHAPLRIVFNRLLEDRLKVFGGRQDVLVRIVDFIQDPKGGYLVITAPPGFGKTALMAKLVSAEPEAYAYHFFTRLYGDDSLSEAFFLKNVVQQMAEWHEYQRELPDGLPDLRALYQQFISEPLSKTQVLVIDGLDEVTQWKLDPYLSVRLPERLHIILTVRDMRQDWRGQYKLPEDQLTHLPLNGLFENDIADVLRSAGAEVPVLDEDRIKLMDQIRRVAAYPEDKSLGADPFYVRVLAEDVAQGRLSVDKVTDWPPGLGAYLDDWMQAVLAWAEEGEYKDAVADLLGTLVVALGPVNRVDLQSINPSLKTRGLTRVFPKVLNQVRRFVVGDDDDGYSLGHPRLREYMRSHEDLDVELYRERLMAYCTSWRKHHSRYALAYYASHLVENGQINDLVGLINSEWIAAQWAVLGTYSTLIADLDRTAKVLLSRRPVDYNRIFAWSVARQTAREQMLNFPVELLVAWVSLGEIKRVLELLKALGNVKGRAAEPMAAVAAELLAIRRSEESPPSQIDYADSAANLLARAIDMLPLVRSASVQKDILASISESLQAESGLQEAARQQLLEQAIEFSSGLSDNVSQTVCLGILASAICHSEQDRETTHSLIDRARQGLEQIDYAPDRLLAVAFLIPAMQQIYPDEAVAIIHQLFTDHEGIFEHSSLGKNPLIRFLDKWQPWKAPNRQVSVEILNKITDFCFAEPDYFYLGASLEHVIRSLIKLDRAEKAFQLVEKVWNRSEIQGARLVAWATKELWPVDAQRTQSWLDGAREFIDYSYHENRYNRESFTGDLAYAYAMTGDWDSAFDLLVDVRPSERVDTIMMCMRLPVVTLGESPPAIKDRISKLVALNGVSEPESRAKVHAVAGRILQGIDMEAARLEIAHAASLCLAELPEGDTDKLRELTAIASHSEGDYQRAVAVLQPMRWLTNIVETLAYLIERTPAASQQALDAYAQTLLEALQSGEKKSLYSEALLSAANSQKQLMQKSSGIADPLDNLILERSHDLPNRHSIPCVAALAASAAFRSPQESVQRFYRIANYIQRCGQNGVEVGSSEISDIYRELASVAILLSDQLPPILKALHSVQPVFVRLEDQVTLDCARCVVLAEIDCSQAMTMLRELIVAITELKDSQPLALYLTRMFADFTGTRVGPRHRQVDVARQIGDTAIRIAHKCHPESVLVLSDLMDSILTIDHPDDLAQALANFCKSCANGPQGFDQDVAGLFDRTLEKASTLSPALFTHVVRPAINSLCQLGNLDAAQNIVDKLQDRELRSEVGRSVQFARERLELGELSDFDQAISGLRNTELAYAILHSVHVDRNWEEIVQYLAENLADDQLPVERERLLSEFIPLMAAPLFIKGGADAIAAMIAEIEAFDRHFRDAAQLITREDFVTIH